MIYADFYHCMSDWLILQNIQNHISLTKDEISLLSSRIKHVSLNKGETLLRQGQLCRNLFFVESGSLRAFNINEEGRESTIMFALPNWWITDMNCFVNQLPSDLSIIALEDCQVNALSYDLLQSLYDEIPQFERLFRILFQNAYIREQKRTLQYLSMNTRERYLNFQKQYPDFSEKITQKQLASYLGVTPEFLSMVKNK